MLVLNFNHNFGPQVASDVVLKQAEVSLERPCSQQKPVLEPSLQSSYGFGFSKFCVESIAAVRPRNASCLRDKQHVIGFSQLFDGTTDTRTIHHAA